MMAPSATKCSPEMLSNHKIVARHRERLAMVYVRQSTAQQLVRHQESTRMQYGLVERALAFGWPRERIIVIDDDLGCSAATAEGRPGFQRLVAEVGLDHVGIILGIEMSRLARSCRDWHQLLEVCAIFGALIGDLDGIYDPSNYNDRLLLGLKGTMSEAELHVLKQRMLQGKLTKARRGELGMPVPTGYVRRPSGEVAKDPDEQVQSTVRIIFEQFEKRGTVYGVLRYMVDHGMMMPMRERTGATKGDLQWNRPNHATLANILHHPIYAGAYVYGRCPTDPRRKQPGRPGTGRTVVPLEQWQVLLKEKLPAYISWEQYEANLRQLETNRNRAMSTKRRGPTLLAGLLVCGRCGHRLAPQYGGGYARYACIHDVSDYCGKFCISVPARVVDACIAELVLRALDASALELSLQVAEDVEQERRVLDESWDLRLERAQHDADRALRQYNAVEPENRLVARTMESQLEEKLTAQRQVQEEHRRFLAEQPSSLTTDEQSAIRALASDIPALWNATSTTIVERQTIVRQLVERVEVHIKGSSERGNVVVHWVGGRQTSMPFIRPVGRTEQLSYYHDLIERIVKLRNDNLTSERIAERLNEEGWRPTKQRSTFNATMVRTIMSRNGLRKELRRNTTESLRALLRKDEWLLHDLATELNMPSITLYSWLRRDWVKGRRLDGRSFRPWIIRADANELAELRALRAAPKVGWYTSQRIARA